MFQLTEQEKKVAVFVCIVLGVGTALELSFKRCPSWHRTLSVIASEAYYPRVNVNRASADELMAVPQVGPVLAKRILEARAACGPFHSPADLACAGLGEGALRRMSKYLSY
ncbi:MAG: helix-hairpin-helix domain-containing protein [Candidatus Omnitrophica bacterium]|nr:helix-hairpin-helix domain-containing protein [Candidatus Omnitrophota bacterium]